MRTNRRVCYLYSIPNREGDEEKFGRYLRLKKQSKKVLVFIGNALKRRYKLPGNCKKHRTEISAIEVIIIIMADITIISLLLDI